MSSSRRLLILAGLALLVGGYLLRGTGPWVEQPGPRTDPFEARVVSIPDGDTLRVRRPGGSVLVVRIQNVECPEIRPNRNCRQDARRGGWDCARQAEPARRARRFVKHRVGNETVRLLPRPADDPRMIARVRTRGGRDLGEALIEAGLCRPWLDRPPTGADPPY